MRPLGGIPLVAHAILHARAARRVARVVVSTDSPEIAQEARERGAEVPFLRPPDLARDESPMLDVVLHAWRHFADRGEAPEAVCLLQPTSPFLRPETIDRAIETFLASRAALLKAVTPVRQHPAWMLRREGSLLVPLLPGPVLRRQDLPELFIPCGALYLYSKEYLEAPGPAVPAAMIELTWPESLDIDEPLDLSLAQWVMEKGLAGRERLE